MTFAPALLAAVDTAFADASRGLRAWDDPHHAEMPRDEEYSRCLDPAKWRIIGARADAWIEALTGLGLAEVDRDVWFDWPDGWSAVVTRCQAVRPPAPDALGLAIGHSRIDHVDDAGVVIGALRDSMVLTVVSFLPDCGCDACDSGSAPELELLDDAIGSIVSGTFRRLTLGEATITVTDRGWSASNLTTRPGTRIRAEADRVLADPTGWLEVCGAAW